MEANCGRQSINCFKDNKEVDIIVLVDWEKCFFGDFFAFVFWEKDNWYE